MPVAARVDITKPSLLLFDPDDEIAVFPACLLRGLTERFYRPDETTSKLEGMMTQQYYDGQSALTLLMTEQQVDLEWVEENFERLHCQMTGDAASISMGVKIYTCEA